jgi:hypothetical protein
LETLNYWPSRAGRGDAGEVFGMIQWTRYLQNMVSDALAPAEPDAGGERR